MLQRQGIRPLLVHNGFINVDNRKMSKSLGNFFTTRDVAEKFGYEPIKFLMLQAHYRTPINYSYDIVEQCRAALDRLYTCRDHLDFAAAHAAPAPIPEEEDFLKTVERRRASFIDAMDDDLIPPTRSPPFLNWPEIATAFYRAQVG